MCSHDEELYVEGGNDLFLQKIGVCEFEFFLSFSLSMPVYYISSALSVGIKTDLYTLSPPLRARN